MLTPLDSRSIWLSSSLSLGFCQINVWSHQTGSAAPAWQPHTHIATHTETTDTESKIKVKLLHIFQIDYDGFFICMFSMSQRVSVQNCQSNSDLISQPQKLLNPVWTLKLAFVDFHIIKWSYLNYDEIIYALVKDVAKYLIFVGNKVQFCGSNGFNNRNILLERL